jgi:beta-lactamase class A
VLAAFALALVQPVAARCATADMPAVKPVLASSAGIAAAARYARARAGTVAFAVLDGRGRLRGLRRTARFPSASVVKAMLMVAVLRRAEGGHLSAGERDLLRRMPPTGATRASCCRRSSTGSAGASRRWPAPTA